MKRRHIRRTFFSILGVACAVLLFVALRPKPVEVEAVVVRKALMEVSVEETARTRVRERFVVSMPVPGKLQRIDLEPGNSVRQGGSVIARILPAEPELLDSRSRDQAEASVDAAAAAVRMAEAQLEKARSTLNYLQTRLQRLLSLDPDAAVSAEDVDAARNEVESAGAAVNVALAEVELRRAELRRSRALTDFHVHAGSEHTELKTVELVAPVDGQVLRVFQESEAFHPAGTPLLEIGDPGNNIEIVSELLSSEAVQVSPGDSVLIDDWGGDSPINGVVSRVEPSAFTKYSALGIEEQRVNVIIDPEVLPASGTPLGDGYRVEVRILVEQIPDAIVIPSAALFREGDDWAVFLITRGRAEIRRVEVQHNNGLLASIAQGVEPGDRVINYPGADITDGARVVSSSPEQ